MSKISGPLLDRIDLHIEVPAVQYRDLKAGPAGTSSDQMREQVIAARRIQQRRFEGTGMLRNGQMTHRQIREFCKLDQEGEGLLKATMDEVGLSARAHDKILRVSRTIADLEDAMDITPAHVNEAINYRMLDRQIWT